MIANRISFIEWLKASGMLVVIYGHTSGHEILNPTLPTNIKQIGVVFFILIAGYLLANESRPWPKVLYNRLFELIFLSFLYVVLTSIVNFYLIDDINESNYLPFMLGINVIFNSFPANPSLWYIGTYIHLMILWALLLRHITIRPWMFIVVVPAEIAVRALLMNSAGDFIAYQLFTNWVSIVLLGMYLGQQSIGDIQDASKKPLIFYVAALLLAVTVWNLATRALGITESNPFGRLQMDSVVTTQITSAILVSLVYFIWGILGFQIFRRLRAGPIVQFFSRNSLMIFILHMPLVYGSYDWINELLGKDSQGFLRLTLNLLIFYVGLGLLSELILKLLKPVAVRNALEQKFISFRER